MKIHGNLYHEIDVDPIDIIEKLQYDFFGSVKRWVEKKDDKFYIMEDCYHNSSRPVKEITPEDIEYLDALILIGKYLKK